MFKNKYLTIYLFGYLFIWVGLTAFFYNSSAVDVDVAENMAWANHLAISYDKHPGLGQLFLKLISYITFGNALLAAVTASGICILIALIYIYKISKLFFTKEEAILLTMLTTFSMFYILRFFIMYNQNTMLLPFWVASIYYFLLIERNNNYKNWILLSVITSLGFYAKFEILLLSAIMFFYFLFNINKDYAKKLIVSGFIFFTAILPEVIWLVKNDYITIVYIFNSVSTAKNHFNLIVKFLLGQLYNLIPIVYVLAPILILFTLLKIKRLFLYQRISFRYFNHPLIITGLYPLFFFWIAQTIIGEFPAGWLMVIMSLFLPAFYKLFNFKLKHINFKKLVIILLTLQITIFSIYNGAKYFNSILIQENIGNSLSIEADNFWEQYNNQPMSYIAGYDPGYIYLAAFSKSKPIFLRDYTLAPKDTQILIALEGCNDSDIKDIEKAGFEILHHKCTNIESVNKYKNQKKLISLFIIEKF
ncbi:glycosyltransferase family 39 protein [Francisella frigiditurris]|uniref:Dolichyl-phosphate-mannose-mannosyltransferase family protein n=1 Tax=Francisella frigiditurris TaxID=1542390 RepID=A0A1J0KUD6_9GAMM|nr:glycosyltransferase family 39 protein [Francisella frigiditurris]APC97295.1 dolichyl-phosphate-mannose-mannosyltransferase family protein [Francisella frigiditurris]